MKKLILIQAPSNAPRTNRARQQQLVVYDHDSHLPLENTTWPQVWQYRMRGIFNQKIEQNGTNAALRVHLLHLLNDAERVSHLILNIMAYQASKNYGFSASITWGERSDYIDDIDSCTNFDKIEIIFDSFFPQTFMVPSQ